MFRHHTRDVPLADTSIIAPSPVKLTDQYVRHPTEFIYYLDMNHDLQVASEHMDRRTYIATVGSAVTGATILSGTAIAESDDGDDPDVRFGDVEDPPNDVYEVGDTVTVTADIENYEDESKTVYVGYSVYNDGFYENGQRTDVAVSVDANDTVSQDLEWPVSSDAPPGDYGYLLKIWDDRLNNGAPDEALKNGLDKYDKTGEEVFKVEPYI
ncbi:hypothetical protein KV541_05965 [Halobacterium salinarum]|nr:hypothetical protein [Halobacterium salinarum]MCF2167701.1 hypothetical protein [Halobacterium salinarum]